MLNPAELAWIAGLRTGEADRSRDGLVSVHDLYDYVYEQMHTAGVRQLPQLWAELEYRVVIARSNLHARNEESTAGSVPGLPTTTDPLESTI